MKDISPKNGAFEMPQLAYSSLGDVISSETLSYHHGKHLKAYVDNLNKLLQGSGLENLNLTEVVKRAEGGLFNNAGQVLNHAMYFEQFGNANHQPIGKVKELISSNFGAFEDFKKEFEQKGATLFGSGWVWLSQDADGKLVITQQKNAENPVTMGLKPLLTFDVWEHAYYLDYQNRRADYLSALWQIVDWSVVESRL
ncbi:MAG: superoxide dismutase [Bacteroidales bacterium]|jgi:Fe-Mn family superoxide dismutase|nr:superoxide dismutase [Bacteroidales bacterium]